MDVAYILARKGRELKAITPYTPDRDRKPAPSSATDELDEAEYRWLVCHQQVEIRFLETRARKLEWRLRLITTLLCGILVLSCLGGIIYFRLPLISSVE